MYQTDKNAPVPVQLPSVEPAGGGKNISSQISYKSLINAASSFLSLSSPRFITFPVKGAINSLLRCNHQSVLFFFSSPVNLTYDVFDGKGESTPLVFLHGLFGSKSNFHSIAKSLVQRTGRKVMQ